jgi:1,4-dihydroxy-2-naphthoate polyprenyltransferase
VSTAVRTLPPTVVALGQLGKFRLFQIWLGPVVAWSLVPGDMAGDPRTVALVGLFFFVVMAGMCATHALDDITGYRDGTDVVNYAPERRRSQTKPLVVGSLSERQAVVFAVVTGTAAVGAVVGFGVVSSFRPLWAIGMGLAAVLLGTQYSAGLKFSYRFVGGGELLTVGALAISALVPYAAVTEQLTLLAVLESTAFGIWLTQVLICSNSADAEADRAAGRRTVAASTSERGNRLFLVAVFAASVLVIVAAVVWAGLTPWALVLLLPTWALQGYVLRHALAGQYRLRRNFGFDAVRLGVLGLVVANVLQ